MKLEPGMMLYHGSYAPVETIDLSICAEGKDFGKGFYLTSDRTQAERFIKTSLAKARALGTVDAAQHHGFVSEFRFMPTEQGVNTYFLPDADERWLQFVALNRRASLAEFLAAKIDQSLLAADIVVGKIANDATNPVITTYLNGLYGPIEDASSAETAIGLLLPNRLKDQYCFRTERAIDCLESMRVCLYDI